MTEYKILGSLKEQIKNFKKCVKSENSDYLTGYICALSTVEGIIAEMKLVDADKLIKKLNDRITGFTEKYPDKKDSVAVQSVKELIYLIELEVEK